MNFVPCSVKHKSCSPTHAAMVRAYTEERQRQEIEHDGLWNAYGTEEHRIWKENGNRLITFKDWLMANKKSANQEQDEIENEKSLRDSQGQDCFLAAHEITANSHGSFDSVGYRNCGYSGHYALKSECPCRYEHLPRQAI